MRKNDVQLHAQTRCGHRADSVQHTRMTSLHPGRQNTTMASWLINFCQFACAETQSDLPLSR